MRVYFGVSVLCRCRENVESLYLDGYWYSTAEGETLKLCYREYLDAVGRRCLRRCCGEGNGERKRAE